MAAPFLAIGFLPKSRKPRPDDCGNLGNVSEIRP